MDSPNYIKLIAHNDREVFVNADKITYAMRATVDETGQDITRIVFDTGQEMDVQDRVDVVQKLALKQSIKPRKTVVAKTN